MTEKNASGKEARLMPKWLAWCIVVAVAGCSRAQAGGREVPMVCMQEDGGPRQHVRASWDIDPGFTPGLPPHRHACPSVEQWKCYPMGRPDKQIVEVDFCAGGWLERLP